MHQASQCPDPLQRWCGFVPGRIAQAEPGSWSESDRGGTGFEWSRCGNCGNCGNCCPDTGVDGIGPEAVGCGWDHAAVHGDSGPDMGVDGIGPEAECGNLDLRAVHYGVGPDTGVGLTGFEA